MYTTTGHLDGTAHGITYTGCWRVDSARPLALAAVVHLAGRQPMALELAQLSGQVVDVGAALPALHVLIERRVRGVCGGEQSKSRRIGSITTSCNPTPARP